MFIMTYPKKRMRIALTYNLKDEYHPDLPRVEDAREEFDSKETVDAIKKVLEKLGHECLPLGFGRRAAENILNSTIDFVFNIAEGYTGRCREAQIPGFLELIGIPYSGPDPLTAAITLDKIMAKRVAAYSGVATPSYFVLGPETDFNYSAVKFPVIVKLAYEGSSKGIRLNSKVNNVVDLKQRIEWLRENYNNQPIIVEQFIAGREFTIGVIGNQKPEVFGIMEIRPQKGRNEDFIYSLEVKRNYLKEVQYFCPPDVSSLLRTRLERAALQLFGIFGCRDISRFDFRVDRYSTPYFLEANPLPGLNPISGDIVIMADSLGISYEKLIKRILDQAFSRYGKI